MMAWWHRRRAAPVRVQITGDARLVDPAVALFQRSPSLVVVDGSPTLRLHLTVGPLGVDGVDGPLEAAFVRHLAQGFRHPVMVARVGGNQDPYTLHVTIPEDAAASLAPTALYRGVLAWAATR